MSAIEVCFIGGFGRSGSTLLERLLGEVPGVCALGEVVHLWRRGIADDELCGCGRAFSKCEFWTEVGEVAFGGWSAVDLDRVFRLRGEVDRFRAMPATLRAMRRPEQNSSVREYAEYFQRVYAAAKQVSGAQLVSDSSKNASTAFALRAGAGAAIDIRVLHIVRDSRGVAYSWSKDVARPEAAEQSRKPLMDRYSPWKAALLWDAHNLAFMTLRRSGVPVHRIEYEDLVRRPAAVLAAAVDFLGLGGVDPAQFIEGERVTLAEGHQVAGNPMRFQTGELRLRADDAWRSRLDPRARRVVSTLTFPMMAGYGYVRTGRSR